MTQTYRTDDFARWGSGQGFNLSPAQVDINFWDLVQRMIAQEARPDPSAGIDHFEIVGINLYVHMTDDTVLGPYVLPVALYNDRGEWQPETAYSVMDTFTINGGLYAVTFDHTSDVTFDPGANDGAGHNYYQLMIQTPGSSLPAGGAVGQLLKKTTTTDYAVGWGYTDASVVDFEPATGSTLTSLNVADALEEIAAAGFSGDAGDVAYDPSTASGLTSTNVQDALDELGEAGGGGAGRQTIWIPATAMTPLLTAGAAPGLIELSSTKNVVNTLDFDAATIEYAQFDIAFPNSWDKSDVFFRLFWSHATTTTNFTAVFNLQATEIIDGANLDITPDATISITDTSNGVNKLQITAESAALTISGADGENLTQFRLSRTATDDADTLTVDARLHGLQLFYNTIAGTDD